MLRRTFRAMGTDVELLLDAAPGERAERALDRAEAEFERLEQVHVALPRRLRALRAQPRGRLDAASPDLVAVVAARARGPGDDRRPLRPDRPRRRSSPPATTAASRRFRPADGPGSLRSRHEPPAAATSASTGLRSSSSAGVRLDLGGIGKGYAADRAAELLARRRARASSTPAGDIAVRGGAWPVGVDATSVTLELTRGGMATSGRDRRRWRRDGAELHHLIDPATGRPAAGDAAPRHGRRRLGRRGRGRGEGGLPRRRRRPPARRRHGRRRDVLAGGLA